MSRQEAMKWSKVEKGARVLIDGERFTVKKHERSGKGADVILVGDGGTFVRGFRKGKVTVLGLPELDSRGKPVKGVDFGKLIREPKPQTEFNGRNAVAMTEWATESKAEKKVREELGGELVGVEAGGVTYVPPLDPSTIKAHLHIFHGFEASTTPYEQLVKYHEAEHSRSDAEPFFRLTIPHTHSKERPA